jgi:imidazolonepropionase-like amidohydrolase
MGPGGWLAVGLLTLAAAGTASGAERQLLHAGRLLTEAGYPAQPGMTLAIEGERIIAVERGFRTPGAMGWPEARVVDLRHAFVLPGLIDLHVHLTSPLGPGGPMRVMTETEADLALRAARYAHQTLAAGFTTVVDLGTGRLEHELAIYAVRNAVSAGMLPGPRILAAGSPLAPTGATRTGLFRLEVDRALPPQGVCDGVDDCRRATREQIARGADVINLYNSGSLNDSWIAPRTFTDGEFAAIVETAHALGRIVIADGHTADGINAALRAGVDVVDTAPWPDETSWRLMREHDVTFVPHLYAFERVVEEPGDSASGAIRHRIPDDIMARLHEVRRRPPSALRAYREGIRIATGSDTGVIPHGENVGELEALVRMGMRPAEVLRAATIDAARALRLDAQTGSLVPGKAADLIAVRASPIEDVGALREPVFIMARGRAHVPDAH